MDSKLLQHKRERETDRQGGGGGGGGGGGINVQPPLHHSDIPKYISVSINILHQYIHHALNKNTYKCWSTNTTLKNIRTR